MQVRAHIRVTGMVQGVGFRFFVHRLAREYRMTGWVRNLQDGDVEILLEGEKGLIQTLARDLYTGNPCADVKGVNLEYESFKGNFKSFDIIG
ncbi:acylphosphatase [bacterium]|nr:acylphosphatase [bacterium]